VTSDHEKEASMEDRIQVPKEAMSEPGEQQPEKTGTTEESKRETEESKEDIDIDDNSSGRSTPLMEIESSGEEDTSTMPGLGTVADEKPTRDRDAQVVEKAEKMAEKKEATETKAGSSSQPSTVPSSTVTTTPSSVSSTIPSTSSLPSISSSIPTATKTSSEQQASTTSETKKPIPAVTAESSEASSPDQLAVCQTNLLSHVNRMHDQVEGQLDMIEEQVAALEALEGNAEPENILSDIPQLKKSLHQLLRDMTKVKRMSMYH